MSSLDQEVEKYMNTASNGTQIIIKPEKSFCGSRKRPASTLGSSNTATNEPRTPPKHHYCPKTPKSISKSNRKKTPSSKYRTPTKTPTESDRFIPPRGSMNFSSSHYKIMQGWSCNSETTDNTTSNGCTDISRTFENVMNENINRVMGDINTSRILQFQSKVMTPKKSNTPASLRQILPSPSKPISRKIQTTAEKVLDAPSYIDDYYLNLLHWSPSVDLLAVALDDSAYVWVPSTGDISCLCNTDDPSNYISSLRWIEQGAHLAIGTASGQIQLWDVEHKKRLRTMGGHASRVSSLSWNSYICSSGSRGGFVMHSDVRAPEHCINRFVYHTQEVCGLQWSPTGRYLATGANDNKVGLWDWNNLQNTDQHASPVHVFTQHKAAVKALAWCPWQHHVLASGGGAQDKTIRFWNVNSGACLNTVDTESQVSSLLWNETYQELLSSHGYPKNQITLWSYPSMTKKAELVGHTGRVLQTTLSFDKTRVMSSAGDETIRLWNCFELSQEKRKEKRKKRKACLNILNTPTIR